MNLNYKDKIWKNFLIIMNEQNFIPLTAQFKIPTTSYQVQLGTVNDKWASNLLKENHVIASYIYKDEKLGEFGLPDPTDIVKWVLNVIPNVSKVRVFRVVKTLIKQTILQKLYPKVAMPISETFLDIVLENKLSERDPIQTFGMKIGEKQRITEELEQLLNDPNVDINFQLRFLIDNAFLSFQFLFKGKYELEWYQLAQTYIDFLKSKKNLKRNYLI